LIAIWIHCSKRFGSSVSGTRIRIRAAPCLSLSTDVELNLSHSAPGIASTASISSFTLPLFEAASRPGGTFMRSPEKISFAASRYSSSVIESPIWLFVPLPVGRRVLAGAVVRAQLYFRKPNAFAIEVMTSSLLHSQLQASWTPVAPP
jgi:hypothetical protein